jgi:cytochrome c556
MSKRIALIAALIIVTGAAALAHEGAVGIAKERMDAMETMDRQSRDISRKIRANRNLASIADDAAKIRASAEKIPDWFPVGSDKGVTMAKPAIWNDWDAFKDLAAKLVTESDKLSTAAESGDPKTIRVQFMALDRACADCHDRFRAKEH